MLVLCLCATLVLPTLELVAQSHHFIYLSSSAAHAISGFEVSQSSGAVTPVAGSPFNEERDPGYLAFHPSGRFLYAVNSTDGSISAFAVNPVTGALTELPASPFAVGAGASPRFIAAESTGKFLYVVGTVVGGQGTTTLVSYYSIDAAGSLNSAAEGTAPPLPLSPVGIVSKPGDRFLHIVGTGDSNAVSIFSLELDPLTGTLSDGHVSTGLGQFAKSVALAPEGQFLFIGRGQSRGFIDAYALPADGIFDPPANTFSIAGSSSAPLALATDISGTHLYAAVANLGLIGFSVSSGDGSLTALPGAAFVEPPILPTVVMAADPVPPFLNLYYLERAFGISLSGALNELAASPWAVPSSVTGIAAASPVDQLPTDPVNPIAGPVTSLAPSSLQFLLQTVGSSSPSRSISLSNTGSAPLQLQGISLTGADAADFAVSHDCLAVIVVNGGCTIAITFQPLFEGSRQASLSVVDNTPDSPHTVALAGTAQLPFTFQLDGSTSAITAGQMAQYNLRLVPAAGVAGKVLLACTGAPDQASCDVPASLDLSGAAAVPFSVKVPTKARSTLAPLAKPAYPSGRYKRFGPIWMGGTGLALLLLLSLRFKARLAAQPRPVISWAAKPLIIGIMLTLVACSESTGPGASSSTSAPVSASSPSAAPAPSPSMGTPVGQYSLTLTATFGTVSESIQLSLAVQ